LVLKSEFSAFLILKISGNTRRKTRHSGPNSGKDLKVMSIAEVKECLEGCKWTCGPADLGWSQRRRHIGLAKAISEAGGELIYVDGREFKFGGTTVAVSQPLWHGPTGSKTGKVIAFAVIDGEERLVFVPDVEGPVEREPVDFIKSINPTAVFIGGPPTYLNWEVEKAVDNLIEIVELRPRFLVVGHHLLRDIDWREKISRLYTYADRRGVEVVTYAELLGRPVELLEASRPRLWGAKKV
jgi:predicted metallo-beta-lactamase superfamily hydrolase